MKKKSSTLVPVFLMVLAIFTLLAFKTSTNSVNNSPKNASMTVPQGVAVVELFTSEGCSSCPPADDVLRKINIQPNVFTLGFHVSYWNRLGWIDSFSRKSYDEKQYAYAERFGTKGVYTPQTVVNGLSEMVGSKQNVVEKAVKTALETPVKVTILIENVVKNDKNAVKNRDISLNYKIVGDYNNDAVLQVALVESNFATHVKNGENEGRTLKHDNVVRDFQTLKLKNTEGSVSIKTSSGWNLKNCAVIMYVQEKGVGAIIGATKWAEL